MLEVEVGLRTYIIYVKQFSVPYWNNKTYILLIKLTFMSKIISWLPYKEL